MQPATTVSFKTVGCRLNQAETARMRAAFEAAGYTVAPFGAPCAVSVIHGCLVTARAEQESLRLVRSLKRCRPRTFVVLAGCVAEAGGTAARAAGADLLVGQADKEGLPELLARHGFPAAPRAPRPLTPRFDTTRAIVKIQDGCDFRCAYCIVPAARGPSRSRPLAEILDEIRRLAGAGYREVVLTGANIGCYADRGRTLAALLEQVETQTPIERIRISSIEITAAERTVIDYMAASRKLCRFLHLPLQSGCDAVLAAMGRRYTARQYQATVAYALEKLGAFGLGTDVLAGFPGETAADFQATERFLACQPFSNLHVFAYSPRPGTPAAALPGQVAEAEKKMRVARLIQLGRRQRVAFARQWIGRRVEALIEAVDANGRGTGWTGEYLPARIQGRQLRPNTIVAFQPESAENEILVGRAAD